MPVQLKSKKDFAMSYFEEDIRAIKKQCFLMLKSRLEALVTDVRLVLNSDCRRQSVRQTVSESSETRQVYLSYNRRTNRHRHHQAWLEVRQSIRHLVPRQHDLQR